VHGASGSGLPDESLPDHSNVGVSPSGIVELSADKWTCEHSERCAPEPKLGLEASTMVATGGGFAGVRARHWKEEAP
jgi:hypothetical protein